MKVVADGNPLLQGQFRAFCEAENKTGLTLIKRTRMCAAGSTDCPPKEAGVRCLRDDMT